MLQRVPKAKEKGGVAVSTVRARKMPGTPERPEHRTFVIKDDVYDKLEKICAPHDVETVLALGLEVVVAGLLCGEVKIPKPKGN